MFVQRILNFLFKPRISYNPLIEVFVFKDRILRNLKAFQKKYPNLQIAPVLKANAYGHGLIEVAKILKGQDIPFLVADSFYEALTLRQNGIKQKILVIGYTTKEQIIKKKLKNVSYTVISLDGLKETAQKLTSPRNFHLKIDTGMGRQGILPEQIGEAVAIIKSNANIQLEGVCTHFAEAENKDEEFTKKQIKEWNEAVKIFKQDFSDIMYFHAAATSGFRFSAETDANCGRLGIGLYGYDPSGEMDLEPALEINSQVTSVKDIKAGESVGYGRIFIAQKDVKVATIPVGYYEGVDRRLSGKSSFTLGRAICSILGRVSMDITSVDVSGVSNPKIGDKVTVVSSSKQDANSVEKIAAICETIPYEILVNIPKHLRRKVV